MKKIFFTISLLLIIFFSIAQIEVKIGYLDSEKIIQLLPETNQAKAILEAEGKAIQDQIEIMQVEYNSILNDYVENENLAASNRKKWSNNEKANKEKEIHDLVNRAQQFQQTAQQKIQQKRDELFRPILENFKKVIKRACNLYGYSLIFDRTTLLYVADGDLSSLVAKDLGVHFNANSQNLSLTNPKIGYLDSQKLLQSLPESTQAQLNIEAEGKAIQNQIEIMQVEYNNKVNDYVENEKLAVGNRKKWTNNEKANKEKEI